MTTHEHFLDCVLQTTKKFNCGSKIITLIPSILFFTYLWCLAETYIETFFTSTNRRRRSNSRVNPWGLYWLKKMLSTILVWSGAQCWSDGLIRFLNAYTIVFLNMINNSLKSDYKMIPSTILTLECTFKLLVCYSMVILIRWCYLHVESSYIYTRRRSRTRRVYNWYTVVPGRQINEIGESGSLLMVNLPPEPQHQVFTENINPKRLQHTQSCHLFVNKTPILSKQFERRRQSI